MSLCSGDLIGAVNVGSGSVAPPSDTATNLKITRKATSAILAGRAVKADSVTHVSYANNNGTLADATVLGIAENTANPGDDVTINLLGTVADASYAGFSVGQQVVLGLNGAVITNPSGHTYLTNLGKALGSSTILATISPPTGVL